MAHELLESRTRAVDNAIAEAARSCLPPPGDHAYTVCGVGGYGRRELFPYSDVDLLTATASEETIAALRQPLSEFLRVLWDRGLRVSHSVRTVGECSRLHVDHPELHISLLDCRPIFSNSATWQTFEAKLDECFRKHRAALLVRLLDITRNRHAKFDNTVFHLEPNIKETCGGLRDLQVVRWLARLLPGSELLNEATAELAGDQDFLFAQRIFLHQQAGRDFNLLTFDLQDQSAQVLPNEPEPPETWMRRYYGHARRIFQASQRAMEFAGEQDTSVASVWRDWRTRLTTGEFSVYRGRIVLWNPDEILSSSDALLRLFVFVGRQGFRLSFDTERLISQAPPAIHTAWPRWRELLSQPNTSLALDEMQRTGVLAAAIPEWQAIDSLVVRDFYHRYTVDEHTLVAIQAIDNLITKRSQPANRLEHLAAEEPELPLVRLAILLHDIGKGTRPGDHVRGSVETAPAILDRLGVPSDQQRMVLFLIEHHLDLSLIMNARDLEDPATARFLTSQVPTQEDLRRLTLLTYGDISGVNPTAMTPWRLERLWQVYLLGSEQFTRELASFRIHRGDVSSALSDFLEGLPRRYLLTHSRAEIERHFEMASFRNGFEAAVAVVAQAGFWLLTVLARDKPGLFASLCGVLASFGMNILKGEASSNAAGVALDLIRFDDPNQTLELNPEEVSRLRSTVESVVLGTLDAGELLRRRRNIRRSAPESKILPRVRFDDDASDSATLIDISAEDRPGLLYDLASAISSNGCNIEVVLIDTEAHRAADVFYVTQNGGKLNVDTRNALCSDLLKAAPTSP